MLVNLVRPSDSQKYVERAQGAKPVRRKGYASFGGLNKIRHGFVDIRL